LWFDENRTLLEGVTTTICSRSKGADAVKDQMRTAPGNGFEQAEGCGL